MAASPSTADVLDTAVVVHLPMHTRFRGLTVRETMIFRGPAGWGEFGAFTEYPDDEAAAWLAAGIESAWLGPPAPVRQTVEVNATVPAVPADRVAEVLARYPGARTAKVKVAEPGQSLDDDVARVAAAREVVERVRIDANGGWSVPQAIAAIGAIGTVEYVEQPCATVAELAAVRRAVSVAIAADESIRRADDPYAVVAADAADIAIVKVAPLGGMRATLDLADTIGLRVVVSSALDSAIGIAAGIATAAAIPGLDHACGLGTGTMFTADVAPSFRPLDGHVTPHWFAADDPAVDPQPVRAPENRQQWWRERLTRCHRILTAR